MWPLLLLCLLFTRTLGHNMTDLAEDSEASEYELDSSGDGSERDGETTVVTDRRAGQVYDETLSHPKYLDSSSYIILTSNKSILEDSDIVAAVITGAVTGAILGAVLTAIFMYRHILKERGRHSQTPL